MLVNNFGMSLVPQTFLLLALKKIQKITTLISF
nr:MAG TPA: hypothetical protein [Caudoviricetes sp.]